MGNWIFKQKENVIRVLLVNFDGNGNHTEDVPVTFANLDTGDYDLRQRFLVGRETKTTISVTETSFTTTISMPAQSVLLLELIKKN